MTRFHRGSNSAIGCRLSFSGSPTEPPTEKLFRTLLALLLLFTSLSLAAAERPRLAILTDIGGDPDDQQSLIRLMLYANEFEIEALLATAVRAKHAPDGPTTRPHLIRQIVDAYGEVLPHLARHANDWPSVETLRATIVSGNPRYGRNYVGETQDTAASRALIERIDAGEQQRPLNISVWGGQTDLAQALWRVKHDRGETGCRAFTKKFRVYDINDQDHIADWMRGEFPGMFYILAKAPSDSDIRLGTYRGMYLTGDESLTSRAWVDEHILRRGPLAALYPTKTYTVPNPQGCLKEGDTPAWFFFLPRGGNDPADPTKPGWGGQFRRVADDWYCDLPAKHGFDPRSTVSRWRPDFQRDFAQRLSWCLATQP